MSLSIIAENSAEDVPPGVIAIALSFPATSGWVIALRSAASSLSTIGFGVLAPMKKPLHNLVLTSGNPDSAMLGTSGNSSERLSPVTAIAFTLPARIIGMAGGP